MVQFRLGKVQYHCVLTYLRFVGLHFIEWLDPKFLCDEFQHLFMRGKDCRIHLHHIYKNLARQVSSVEEWGTEWKDRFEAHTTFLLRNIRNAVALQKMTDYLFHIFSATISYWRIIKITKLQTVSFLANVAVSSYSHLLYFCSPTPPQPLHRTNSHHLHISCDLFGIEPAYIPRPILCTCQTYIVRIYGTTE